MRNFGVGYPEAPVAVELQHAGGGVLASEGKVRRVPVHTGRVVLETCGARAGALAQFAHGGEGSTAHDGTRSASFNQDHEAFR